MDAFVERLSSADVDSGSVKKILTMKSALDWSKFDVYLFNSYIANMLPRVSASLLYSGINGADLLKMGYAELKAVLPSHSRLLFLKKLFKAWLSEH